jgi:DNA (cytosine-5)-methyltransferase 1
MANTLDTQMQQHTIQGARIRRLTPTECCRLQGFPDDWCDGVSDSQKYHALGNAVTVDVVEAIARRLKDGTI